MTTGFTPDQSRRLEAIRAMPTPTSREERQRLDLRSVAKGGFVRFRGETYQVVDLTVYRETDWKFQKQTGDEIMELTLYSLSSGKTMYVEWSFDDTLEVYETTEKIRMSSLRTDDDERIEVRNLDDLDHDDDGVKYRNNTYWYDDNDSYAAIWVSDGRTIQARFYEFWCDETNTALTIEVWGSEQDPEVFLSREVNAREFEILVPGTQAAAT